MSGRLERQFSHNVTQVATTAPVAQAMLLLPGSAEHPVPRLRAFSAPFALLRSQPAPALQWPEEFARLPESIVPLLPEQSTASTAGAFPRLDEQSALSAELGPMRRRASRVCVPPSLGQDMRNGRGPLSSDRFAPWPASAPVEVVHAGKRRLAVPPGARLPSRGLPVPRSRRPGLSMRQSVRRERGLSTFLCGSDQIGRASCRER